MESKKQLNFSINSLKIRNKEIKRKISKYTQEYEDNQAWLSFLKKLLMHDVVIVPNFMLAKIRRKAVFTYQLDNLQYSPIILSGPENDKDNNDIDEYYINKYRKLNNIKIAELLCFDVATSVRTVDEERELGPYWEASCGVCMIIRFDSTINLNLTEKIVDDNTGLNTCDYLDLEIRYKIFSQEGTKFVWKNLIRC